MTIKELWELRDRYIKDHLVKNGVTPETYKEATRYAESALADNHPEEYTRWLKMRDFPAFNSIYVRILRYFGKYIYPRPVNIDHVLDMYQAVCLVQYGIWVPSAVRSKARLFTWQEFLLYRQCSILSELGLSSIDDFRRALG